MNNQAVRQIVIVGGGVTGWVAAAGIAHALRGQDIEITVLDDPGEKADGAEATLPISRNFNQRLDINEQQLMRETAGAFSLGTRFQDWTGEGHDYFQPMGAHGASIEFVHFHNYAIKARQAGDQTPFNDYSLCAVAARQGKFSHPGNDPNSILSTLAYAHQHDASLYAGFMQRHAQANGVKTLPAKLADVALRPDDGFIQAITTDSGERREADLFIDCSGQASLLLGKALQVPFESWHRWLPANRVLKGFGPATDLLPCPTVKAMDSGWHQTLTLQDREAHRLVFHDRYLEDDSAIAALQMSAATVQIDDLHFARFRSGFHSNFWSGNCVALGAAAGCLEPLDGTSLALLQSGLMRLISMFPDKTCNRLIANEYNEVTRAEYENIRDFLVLHYRASQRGQQPFWSDCLKEEVPASLAHKIRLFMEHGQVAFYEEESYPETSWVSVWLGQDQWPRSYDTLLDNYDFKRLKLRFEQMHQIIAQATDAMPSHKEYLARYCQLNN